MEHFVRVKKRRDMEDHNYFVPHRADLIETYVSSFLIIYLLYISLHTLLRVIIEIKGLTCIAYKLVYLKNGFNDLKYIEVHFNY